MSLKVEGIPQRDTGEDPGRDKLKQKIKESGGDPNMLPITPATIIAYGRIGGGKSSIMYSWLKNMFPNYYDEVLIYCASSDSKKAFESLPQKHIVFMTDYNDKAFSTYISELKDDQLKRIKDGKKALNVFIGFDDIVFENAIGGQGKPSMAEKVMLISRHELNATIFICVQHSKQVNSAMRNNTIYNVILPVQRNDLEKIAEEHSGHLSKDEFISMYYKIMNQPNHPFIVVDYKAPEERRFRDRWDKIITFNKGDEPPKALPGKRSEENGVSPNKGHSIPRVGNGVKQVPDDKKSK
jgi:GTPase SAR1 family protein